MQSSSLRSVIAGVLFGGLTYGLLHLQTLLLWKPLYRFTHFEGYDEAAMSGSLQPWFTASKGSLVVSLLLVAVIVAILTKTQWPRTGPPVAYGAGLVATAVLSIRWNDEFMQSNLTPIPAAVIIALYLGGAVAVGMWVGNWLGRPRSPEQPTTHYSWR